MQKEKNLKRNLAIEVLEKADIVPVIRVKVLRGKGTVEDKARAMLSFYLTDGTFIGEISANDQACCLPKLQLDQLPSLKLLSDTGHQ